MQPLQIILDFLKEMGNRLATKSPMFFKVLQVIGASLTMAGYIPSLLQQAFNVEVPGNMIWLCENIAKYATGFFAASMFAAKSPIVGQTENGNEVKVTSEKKMPFTAKAEQKEVAKTIPAPDVIEEVKIDTSNFPDSSTVPPKE